MNANHFFKKFQYVSNKVNPQMFGFIEGFRNHLAIIDGEKSVFLLKKALLFLRSLQQEQKTILFINNNPKLSFLTKKTALELNQPYSNEYWIPGLLTNWSVSQSMIRSFKYSEHYFGSFLEKKKMVFPKYVKQKKKLEGLTIFKEKPSVLVLMQFTGNEAILREAKLLNIPVVAFTDCTQPMFTVEYPIPADTQSLEVLYLFCRVLCRK